MVQRIRQDHVLRTAEARENAAVRRVTRVEQDSGLGRFESGQLLLERVVRQVISRDESARPRAYAPPVRRLRQRRTNGRMRGEAQVIVGAEVDQPFTRRELDLGSRGRPQRLEGAQQPIRCDRSQLLSCQRIRGCHGGRTVGKCA